MNLGPRVQLLQDVLQSPIQPPCVRTNVAGGALIQESIGSVSQSFPREKAGFAVSTVSHEIVLNMGRCGGLGPAHFPFAATPSLETEAKQGEASSSGVTPRTLPPL